MQMRPEPSDSDRPDQSEHCSFHNISLNPSDRIRLMRCWDSCVTIAKLIRLEAKSTSILSTNFYERKQVECLEGPSVYLK